MEKPNIENYNYPRTNHLRTKKYVDDLNLYIDQLLVEKKELIEEGEHIRKIIATHYPYLVDEINEKLEELKQ